jgi:hypothetical protein
MVGLIPLLAAAAAIHTVDVQTTLGKDVVTAKAKSAIPVYYPSTVPSPQKNVYPDVDAARGSYTLHLGLAKGCGGAGACYLAYFTGEDGGTLLGNKRIKLHDGIKGRYARSTCGANCSAPLVSWKIDGIAYSVAVKGLPGKERRAIKKVANSAIDAGQR